MLDPADARQAAAHLHNAANQLTLAMRWCEGPHIRNEFRAMVHWITRQEAFYLAIADHEPPTDPPPEPPFP